MSRTPMGVPPRPPSPPAPEPKTVFRVVESGDEFCAVGYLDERRSNYQANGKTLREAIAAALDLRDRILAQPPRPPQPLPPPQEYEPYELVLDAEIPAYAERFAVQTSPTVPCRLDSFMIEESIPGATTIVDGVIDSDFLVGFRYMRSAFFNPPRADISWGSSLSPENKIKFLLKNARSEPVKWKAIWRGITFKRRGGAG